MNFRVSQAASMLGVCIKTIHRWNRSHKLNCYRTPGGHRRIPLKEIQRLQGKLKLPEKPLQTAIYARVSSHDQKIKSKKGISRDKLKPHRQLATFQIKECP